MNSNLTYSQLHSTAANWGPARRIWNVITRTYKYMNVVLKAHRKGESRFPGMMAWGQEMTDVLGLHVHRKGTPSKTAVLMVGNHMSYLDIPLLMAVAPVVFVAKRQLSTWPLFGAAMKSVGTVFVDRDSRDSRKGAADAIAPRIVDDKQSVAIFPSGTTSLDEAKPWRWGAFVIAKRYGIPVQPFRIRFEPARTAAFVGEDYFLSHLWGVAKCPGGITTTVEFAEPFMVEDPQKDAEKWWRWSCEGLAKS